jgi:hypothetical protein
MGVHLRKRTANSMNVTGLTPYQHMTKNVLLAVRDYICLTAKEKLDFLSQIRKIEKMKPIVRLDYEKTLIDLANQ